jgi:hypothetical protein
LTDESPFQEFFKIVGGSPHTKKALSASGKANLPMYKFAAQASLIQRFCYEIGYLHEKRSPKVSRDFHFDSSFVCSTEHFLTQYSDQTDSYLIQQVVLKGRRTKCLCPGQFLFNCIYIIYILLLISTFM